MKNRFLLLVLFFSLLFTLSACGNSDQPSGEPLLIGVPNDSANLARAIKLLEKAGLIEVDPAAGYTPELKDITRYLYNIEISPVSANTLPSTLEDYAASTINGTYAVSAGLIPSKDALITEQQSEGEENPYINVIVARTKDKDDPIYQTIVEAYQSQEVAEYSLTVNEEISQPAFDYDPNFSLTKEEAEAMIDYSSSPEGKTSVKVGVCGSKNETWRIVQRILDEKNSGIYIELVEFDAYNLPNEALNSGEIDLNSFQHIAYLNTDCAENAYDLTPIGNTSIAPLSLYSKKFASIDALKEAAGPAEQRGEQND